MNDAEKMDQDELKDYALEGVSGGVRRDGTSKDHRTPAPEPLPCTSGCRDLDDLEVER